MVPLLMSLFLTCGLGTVLRAKEVAALPHSKEFPKYH